MLFSFSRVSSSIDNFNASGVFHIFVCLRQERQPLHMPGFSSALFRRDMFQL